jgi:hypothetical protein
MIRTEYPQLTGQDVTEYGFCGGVVPLLRFGVDQAIERGPRIVRGRC